MKNKIFRKGAVLERAGQGISKAFEIELSDNDPTEEEIAAIDIDLFQESGYNEQDSERVGYSNYSYWRSTFQVFWKNKVARVLLVLLFILLLFTFIQPILPGQNGPAEIFNDANGDVLRNLEPGGEFLFGTNAVGQDLWSRIWSGTRTSLFLAAIVATSNCVIGITIGVIWGYVRKLESFFTQAYVIVDNIPRTIILILISYIMSPGMLTMIISMCCVGWLGMARFIRNQIVMLRDRDYNLASRCLGTETKRIMLRNLLPYLVSVIMLQTALAIPSVISDEVFLTYCGLGMPKNTASLGNLVEEGRRVMMSPSLSYQLIFPSCVVAFISISFYLIGNAFADASDPRNHL